MRLQVKTIKQAFFFFTRAAFLSMFLKSLNLSGQTESNGGCFLGEETTGKIKERTAGLAPRSGFCDAADAAESLMSSRNQYTS